MQRPAASSSASVPAPPSPPAASRKPGAGQPGRGRGAARGGIGCLSSACMMELIAGAWVSAYHAAFRGAVSVEHEEAEVGPPTPHPTDPCLCGACRDAARGRR